MKRREFLSSVGLLGTTFFTGNALTKATPLKVQPVFKAHKDYGVAPHLSPEATGGCTASIVRLCLRHHNFKLFSRVSGPFQPCERYTRVLNGNDIDGPYRVTGVAWPHESAKEAILFVQIVKTNGHWNSYTAPHSDRSVYTKIEPVHIHDWFLTKHFIQEMKYIATDVLNIEYHTVLPGKTVVETELEITESSGSCWYESRPWRKNAVNTFRKDVFTNKPFSIKGTSPWITAVSPAAESPLNFG